MSIKIKILLLIFFLSLQSFPQSNLKEFQKKIDDLIFSNDFFGSTIPSIEIYDLTADLSLYKLNEKLLLNPASNEKIFTSAAAILYLGEDYKFITSLYYDGEIKDSILYGNLYIKGGCDPLYSPEDLNQFINRIKSVGIKKIDGNLCADISMKDSLFWGNGWMWDDDPSSDAPYLSALNINENTIQVKVITSAIGEKPLISIYPQTKYVNIINNAITTNYHDSEKVKVTRDWINRKNIITVNGKFQNNTYPLKDTLKESINIFNPENYFLTLFSEKLDSSGVKISGNKLTSPLPLHAVNLIDFYRPLDTVITKMNKESDNLCAEMLLYALAEKYFGKPASAVNGVKLIDSLIAQTPPIMGEQEYNPEDYSFADGSGVSRYNLVSAELILSLLKYIYSNIQLFEKIYNSFPVSGVDGTLKDRMKNSLAENNIHAKTGTLSGISCLSGYARSFNSHIIAFAILFQNYVNGKSYARDIQDKICNILADYK
jgi:serine-type D-Ala-D-Ala carboxypeptidase/endopeptidase (penicillin-binding protein 4)